MRPRKEWDWNQGKTEGRPRLKPRQDPGESEIGPILSNVKNTSINAVQSSSFNPSETEADVKTRPRHVDLPLLRLDETWVNQYSVKSEIVMRAWMRQRHNQRQDEDCLKFESQSILRMVWGKERDMTKIRPRGEKDKTRTWLRLQLSYQKQKIPLLHTTLEQPKRSCFYKIRKFYIRTNKHMSYIKLYSKFQTFQVEGNRAKRLYVNESLDQDWNILWILFLQFHIVEANFLLSQHFEKRSNYSHGLHRWNNHAYCSLGLGVSTVQTKWDQDRDVSTCRDVLFQNVETFSIVETDFKRMSRLRLLIETLSKIKTNWGFRA